MCLPQGFPCYAASLGCSGHPERFRLQAAAHQFWHQRDGFFPRCYAPPLPSPPSSPRGPTPQKHECAILDMRSPNKQQTWPDSAGLSSGSPPPRLTTSARHCSTAQPLAPHWLMEHKKWPCLLSRLSTPARFGPPGLEATTERLCDPTVCLCVREREHDKEWTS